MGMRPHAVLAFGYDLSEDLDGYDKPVPAWHDDEDAGRYDNACRALLAAVGRVVAPGEYFDPDDAENEEACGVKLIKLGYDGDESPVFLSVKHFETDWDDNIVVTPEQPEPERLARLEWALDVLGFTRQTPPTWLLGTYYG